MLSHKEAVATIPVRDLAIAAEFYGGKLGFEPQESVEGETLIYRTGATSLFVYVSEYAGTNKATAATFVVGDELAPIIKTLVARGVDFEHYDMPGMEREGEIHSGGGMKVAWFKDPDGNIISLANG
ncbi:MAG: VOC family protein [Lysobacterales bacterium]